MNDYSDERTILLEKISVKQIATLVQLLQNHNYNKKEFIEQRYKEQSTHFEQTLQFLIDIAWVTETADSLNLAYNLPKDDTRMQDEIAKGLVEGLVGNPNPYQSTISEYLAHYVVSDVGIVHRSFGEQRLDESVIRNLLIDLKVVLYEMDHDWYRLQPEYAGIYLWAKNNKNTASKEALEANNQQKDALGAAAELVVLEFEKTRVGPVWRDRVDHISAKQPFACYDVKSVSVAENIMKSRFIEVKAVDRYSFHFFWTASELQAAQLLAEEYYLYLLPVERMDRFCLDQLLIIQDPYKNVYCCPQNWIIKDELISCYLAKDTSFS